MARPHAHAAGAGGPGHDQLPAQEPRPGSRARVPIPEKCDQVTLLRPRKSRIYFLRTFFDYPITLSLDTIKKLGLPRMMKIGFSLPCAALFPFRPEKTWRSSSSTAWPRVVSHVLQVVYGEGLGRTVFGDQRRMGAQRVKGLSILGTLKHIFGKLLRRRGHLSQKGTETSLIEQFLYPKYGPGRCGRPSPGKSWTAAARLSQHQRVNKIHLEGERIVAVEAVDPRSGQATVYRGDWFFSTMPVKDLVRAGCRVPGRAAAGQRRADLPRLLHRRPLAEGVEGPRGFARRAAAHPRQLDLYPGARRAGGPLADLQQLEPLHGLRPVERLGGLEYFCYESDDLWKMSDQELIELGGREMEKIGIIERACWTPRDPHTQTYPAYFGTHGRFDEIRRFLDPHLESLPAGPQRHAPLQQPGPFDAHGHGGGRQYRRRSPRQIERVGREHRAGLSRSERVAAGRRPARRRTQLMIHKAF